MQAVGTQNVPKISRLSPSLAFGDPGRHYMNGMPTLTISLILLFAMASCNVALSSNSKSAGLTSNNSDKLPEADILSKELVVFIGRGGCCYGHIISIDRGGDLKYSVGTYSRPVSDSRSSQFLPEAFDVNLIEIDKKYEEKFQRVSVESLRELERLVRGVESLRFRDQSLAVDDYLYHVFLDKQRVAYGYSSNRRSFPANLQRFIDLVTSQIKLHELPGMA